MEDFITLIMLSLFVVSIITVILLPTLIARFRRCQSVGLIFLVNILGVWIGIGWPIALIWSIIGEAEPK